jgi:hypothetical protein
MDGLTWGQRADMLGIPAHLCATLTSQGRTLAWGYPVRPTGHAGKAFQRVPGEAAAETYGRSLPARFSGMIFAVLGSC